MIFALVLSGCARFQHAEHQDPPTEDNWAKSHTFFVPYQDGDLSLEPEEVIQAGAEDYPKAIEGAARKDKSSLARVFEISASAQWDAAGGEFHSSTLKQLLLLWGDYDFAAELKKVPKAERKRIYYELGGSGHTSLPTLFPHTHKAGTT